MVRKAERKDIPRIAEIIIFGKRAAYRKIFQNDLESFGNLQVVSLAKMYEGNSGLLETMLVYDDGIVKGVLNRQKKDVCFLEGSRCGIVKDALDKGDRAGCVEISDFYVEPFFLGQGIGTKMLKQLIQEAECQEIQSLCLWVVEQNSRARKFYERHGFVTEGRRAVIEGTEEMEIYYERRL